MTGEAYSAPLVGPARLRMRSPNQVNLRRRCPKSERWAPTMRQWHFSNYNNDNNESGGKSKSGMEGSEASLYQQQLQKLPPLEGTLDELFQCLWDTRKTGLTPSQKSHLQSCLGLPSSHQLHPVLACLRSLIRKCVHESLDRDDIQKLFPADLSMELRSILVVLLQKHQNQWKEEASNDHDQSLWQRMKTSSQQNSTPPALTHFAASEFSSSTWPRVEEPQRGFVCVDQGASFSVSDLNPPCIAPVSVQRDDGLSDNLVSLPCLKSMTWTMENHTSASVNRVAVINLKLQDYAKSPSGEIEVKFQLSRNTIDAMLRSMVQISEQLSKAVSYKSESFKRQKQ